MTDSIDIFEGLNDEDFLDNPPLRAPTVRSREDIERDQRKNREATAPRVSTGRRVSLNTATSLSEGALDVAGLIPGVIRWAASPITGEETPFASSQEGLKQFAERFGWRRSSSIQASVGAPSGAVEKGVDIAAQALGGSILPGAGFLAWGGRLNSASQAGVRTALQSKRWLPRTLARGAAESAKRPGLFALGELGAAAGAGAGGGVSNALFPENDTAEFLLSLGGGILGGGATSLAALGRHAGDEAPIAFRNNSDGTSDPIQGPSLTRDVDEEIVELKLPKRDPEAPVSGQAAEEVSDEIVGTIGRRELDEIVEESDAFVKAPKEKKAETISNFDWEDVSRDLLANARGRIGILGTPEDAESLMAALGREIDQKTVLKDIDVAVTAQQIADDLGTTPEDLLAFSERVATQGITQVAALMGVRTAYKRVQSEMNSRFILGVDYASATPDFWVDAAEGIHNLYAIHHGIKQAQAQGGRVLRINQLPDADTYIEEFKSALKTRVEGRPLDKTQATDELAEAGEDVTDLTQIPEKADLGSLPDSPEDVQRWLEEWSLTGGDPKKQFGMLDAKLGDLIKRPNSAGYVVQSAANLYVANLLSGLKTYALNATGPALMATWRRGYRQVGSRLLSVAATKETRQTQAEIAKNLHLSYRATRIAQAEAFNAAKDMMAGTQVKHALSNFARASVSDETALAVGNSIRSAQQGQTSIGGGSIFTDAVSGYGPVPFNMEDGIVDRSLYGLGNLMNLWPRAAGRVMLGMDDFAKTKIGLTEVKARAVEEAALREITEPREIEQLVKERMQAALDPETGKLSDLTALERAETLTLTKTPGRAGTAFRKFSSGVNGLRANHPWMRFILPIYNVPMNGMHLVYKSSGVNLFRKHYRDELAGKMGPIAQADAAGRTVMGTSVLAAGAYLAEEGYITGALPSNPRDRKAWQEKGIQPYSLKVGDGWLSFDRLDVLGALLSIPATLLDVTKHTDDEESAYESFGVGVAAMAEWMMDRAALRAASDLINFSSNPLVDPGEYFKRTTANIASNLAPFGIAVAQKNLTPLLDNRRRLKNTWTDYIQATVPGLSRGLEPARNILGEPIDRPENVAGGLLPFSFSSSNPAVDDIMDELYDLYQETGYFPTGESDVTLGFFDAQEAILEDGYSLYDHFHSVKQTYQHPDTGLTYEAALRELINSPEYQEAVDGSATRAETSRGDLNRPFLVSQLTTEYNRLIKAEIAEASPIALNYLATARAKEGDRAYLNDLPFEQALNDPRQLETRGVDVGGFQDQVREGATGALLDLFEGEE